MKVALEKARYELGVTRNQLKEVGQEKIDFEIDLEVSRKENKKLVEKMEEFDGIDLSRYQEQNKKMYALQYSVEEAKK